MAQPKIIFEQFIEAVDEDNKSFVEDLHAFMLEKGCKVAFEEKKSGFLASYKFGKPPRALMNFLFRKQGMLTRIYGENVNSYPDFLNSLPKEMVASVEKSGTCKRITQGTCSPKCIGYDFMIGQSHFQKCRYSCFEFLMTNESNHFIKEFVEREIAERSTIPSKT